MTEASRQLGEDLARAASSTAAGGTVSAQVIDLTDNGTVNVMMGGSLLLDVPCADSYRNRKRDDWVAVRPGARPVVMWRLGPDPVEDSAEMRDVVKDVQTVRAVTWGTSAPSGSGWQEAVTPWVRQAGDGQVEIYYQVASTSAPSPAAPAAKGSRITATSSGVWRGGRPDAYADYPTQGDWTGRGDRRGGWFYGTKIADACAGKTVARMTVQYTRRRGSGVNARRPMHLYLHDYTSAPSGQLSLNEGPEELLSLSAGGTGTATLPASWRDKLAAGTRRGLAIYAHGSRDYAAFSGGTVTITFS
ncbi:hypothetical protein [Streptomyces sp. B15]|uniref:hypothetical protein n=1 Tax=Streptomyces sp. B15 TaxID=1537797 RepID=UPI001B3677B5|nr:hypothetical protein [Streptomyces sp. B15]MBQ1122652.1 hypothetical protein [Streptomyces sp. B15]